MVEYVRHSLLCVHLHGFFRKNWFGLLLASKAGLDLWVWLRAHLLLFVGGVSPGRICALFCLLGGACVWWRVLYLHLQLFLVRSAVRIRVRLLILRVKNSCAFLRLRLKSWRHHSVLLLSIVLLSCITWMIRLVKRELVGIDHWLLLLVVLLGQTMVHARRRQLMTRLRVFSSSTN